MQWIHHYQLFLFDLDGLLVNTEEVHFHAYRNMLALEGCDLQWELSRVLFGGSLRFRKAERGDLSLLPGTFNRLGEALRGEAGGGFKASGGRRGSFDAWGGKIVAGFEQGVFPPAWSRTPKSKFVAEIKRKNPVLDHVTHWITRKDYTRPKPHPESYLTAIQRFSRLGDKVIGFEDTPRGINALMQTKAKAVMITQTLYPDLPSLLNAGVKHFQSLEGVLDTLL